MPGPLMESYIISNQTLAESTASEFIMERLLMLPVN